MSKKNTMTVRMRESILGTTAGVFGAAALVQTAILYFLAEPRWLGTISRTSETELPAYWYHKSS